MFEAVFRRNRKSNPEQWTRDKLLLLFKTTGDENEADEKKKRLQNVVLKDIEDSVDGASKQRDSLKVNDKNRNTYTKNQGEISKISWDYNKERMLGKFNSLRAYLSKRDRERHRATNSTNLWQWMTEQKYGIFTEAAKCHKEQEAMESHDPLYPEG